MALIETGYFGAPSDEREPLTPPLSLLASETLVGMDIASLPLAALPLARAPKGDGHPVMVLPGMGTSDWSTVALRSYLRTRSYRTYGWKMGMNRGPSGDMEDRLRERLARIYDKNGGQKISLVGWSLGGIIAREIAHEEPDLVRQVITLGSPFGVGAKGEGTTAGPIFNLLNQEHSVSTTVNERRGRLRQAPPVPTTAVYSETDGIAGWQASIQIDGHEETENIRVPGTHIGLGFNAAVYYVLAERLAQKDGQWSPFDRRKGARRAVYGRAYPAK
ncbi:MAG: alpha/beta hydrolase [Alphaproteobacteria bacterium]